jgi:glycosyltransferase involved in cell wall biosynthesis
MQKDILFLSQKQKRGGAVYEEQIKNILQMHEQVDVLELDATKNKLFVFTKLKYFYQIKAYKPFKRFKTVIANKAGIYAGILSRKADKKVLILHHFFDEENVHGFLNPFLKRKLLASLKKFDIIITVSTYWQNFFSAYVNKNKIEIVYNAFNTAQIDAIKNNVDTAHFKQKFGIPENKILVYAGNALRVKGYAEVIRLLDTDKYFIVTSGNKDNDAIIKHLHLDLSYQDYIGLLCSSDVTVILSEFLEGWNRIAHESLLCNTPVIGTNIGGMGELLQKSRQITWQKGDDLKLLIDNAITDKEGALFGYKYAAQYNLAYLENRCKEILL